MRDQTTGTSRPFRTASRLLPPVALALAQVSLASGGGPAERSVVDVRFGITASRTSGERAAGCDASKGLEFGAKTTWRASLGPVLAGPGQSWKAAEPAFLCGDGPVETRGQAQGQPAGVPYLVVEVSVQPLRRSGLSTDLQVSVSTRRLIGFSDRGEPTYEAATERRMVSPDDTEGAAIPILIADGPEEERLGIRDVTISIHARLASGPPAAAYGAISVRTDETGAEVLLDGGPVGRTTDGTPLELRNVPVGAREVAVRDAAGRRARKVVHVVRDRTVLVALPLKGPQLAALPGGFVRLGKNERGYEQYRRRRDGAVMVEIPEGDFLMGNLDTENRPLPHTVCVSTFLFDQYPVTWSQYKRFLEATGWPLPPHEPYWGTPNDHPASFVTWEESRAYCEWVGGRLPREAERERAARGTDNRKYPWGDEEPTPDLAVYRHRWGYEATGSVESHPNGVNAFGLFDTGGNVWEWCEDWYDPKYYEVSPRDNPRGPLTGRARVVRGGSWDSRPTVLSCSFRNFGYIGYREGDFGFRCAADPPR